MTYKVLFLLIEYYSFGVSEVEIYEKKGAILFIKSGQLVNKACGRGKVSSIWLAGRPSP